ncbi:2-hydroxyacid dehydrogenase [Halobacillus naozhouensis]|uniref:2-hydroxyacid dehydrogenase n=1 Tax=Halobacillus naozhouensis TaxID=554880 RepID=A0ABY8J2L0_9BACI|nr:2-hydroxyacid dehydrogenase [Halobacillus naozhouensis]WFT75654.1 2-hydroxyacid dehydrogenase [Halobacillus naozhouensis]
MQNKKIIYFDKVFDQFKQILHENKPEGFDLQFWTEMGEERKSSLEQAEYLLVATEKLDEDILSRAKQARFIQKTGIGVDNINLEAAEKYQLPVANTPGANAAGVAELTILMILSLYRKLPLLNQETKSGKWLMWKLRPSSFEMEGKTHGFIGFGNIGRETARRSRALGTNVVYYDKFQAPAETERELDAAYLPLEEVLKTSDIISLHIPFVPETKRLIGARELQLMKSNTVLINVSRGGIVDEKALAEALNNEVIAGAGIDVWETEPPELAHPLLKLENVIATPHIGAGTRDTLNRVLRMAFENIKRVDEGNAPNFVVNGVGKPKVENEVR